MLQKLMYGWKQQQESSTANTVPALVTQQSCPVNPSNAPKHHGRGAERMRALEHREECWETLSSTDDMVLLTQRTHSSCARS